jgi:uncharacterized heparinase superfamily protein
VSPSIADVFLLVPPDLRTADPTFVTELQAGEMGLAGYVAGIGHHSPFEVIPPNRAWLAELHAFEWLRHLRAAASPEATLAARQIVSDWIGRNSSPGSPLSWEPEIVARRVTAWIKNSDLLLDGAKPAFYRLVTRSLGAQIRYLDVARQQAAPGPAALRCLCALLLVSLAIAGHERHLPRLQRAFLAELARQIGPDGAPACRSSDVVLDLLIEFLPLRHCYLSRGFEPPPALVAAIEQMIAFVRFMRLGDGALARFNGVGASRSDLLATIVPVDATEDIKAETEPRGGYHRLEAGPSIVLVDAGPAPPLELAAAAHAGCLSFEFSHGPNAIIVNCGALAGERRAARSAQARATQSHSTLCVASRASAEMIWSTTVERATGAPCLSGPHAVAVETADSEAARILTMTHDGYVAEFGLIHARQLSLASGGDRLSGIDRLSPIPGGPAARGGVPFAIHFHLGPSIARVTETAAGCFRLTLADGSVWHFTTQGIRASVEASADFTGPEVHYQRRQIVLRASSTGETRISWSLTRIVGT